MRVTAARPALALLCLALACLPALAKDPKPAKHDAQQSETKLPEPLTRESIRELVSRLSDAEVRALLIKQLDRTAVPAPAPKKITGMAGMAQSTGQEVAALRARAAEVLAFVPHFPEALGQVGTRIAEPHDRSRLWELAFWFLVMLAAATAGEAAFGMLTRNARRRFEEARAEGLGAGATRLLLRSGIGVAHLTVFTAVAIGLFFALWQGHAASRLVLLLLFAAVVGVRLAALVARLILEPAAPHRRLLPLDDRAAGVLYWGIVRLAVLFAVVRVGHILLSHFDAPVDALAVWDICVGTVGVAMVLDTVWRLRAAVAALIRGSGEPGPLRGLLAELWPVLATIYLLLVYLSRMHGVLSGDTETTNAPIISVLLILVLPLVDMLGCRIVSAMMRGRKPAAGADAEEPSALAVSFEPVLQKAIHIVVIVAGLLILANLWELDLFAVAERGLGGRITGAFLSIAMTTLLAWILWQVAHTVIEQRMGAEAVVEGRTVSRLRTLLPLIRMVVQVTILLIAVLSILAALGVNILPLLAGASVLGLAVGFGSQTLVRDIVSGAFFLMDDAFRLGEYIEVGDAKGSVEKIGVRSVILRHHRGALNVLPYGEIKRLRNTSRDWMIMVMEFRLAHGTDIARVKKVMKKIGQDLAADEAFSQDILEPLKSQGVLSTDDTALVIRAKFKARAAGGGAYMFRREAYARILKAFEENGIRFASRQVTVNVPPGASADAAAGAAASATIEGTGRKG